MALIPLGFWAASGAGGSAGGSDFQLISTQVLGSTATSVTFSSIPSTFRHLQIRTTNRSTSTSLETTSLRLNGDTAANYAQHTLYGNGSSTGSTSGTSTPFIDVGFTVVSNAIANSFQSNIIDLLDYSQTTKNKTIRSLYGYASSTNRIAVSSGVWINTSSVNSLTLFLNTSTVAQFAIGSRFSLYGWN